MVNAFSTLSLKRHPSSREEEESIHKKVSRLKLLRFYLLSKFTNSVDSEHSNQNNGFIPQSPRKKEYYHGLLRKGVETNHRYSAVETATATTTTSAKKLKGILINHNKSSSAVSDPTHQHYSSHISISNMTINSEDLTAKEFASIAGIQILPEEEEEEEESDGRRISDEDDTSILYTISSFDVGNSVMSRQSRDSTRPSRIWDPEFWQRPYHHEEKDLPILNQFRSEKASVIRKGRFEIYLDH